MTSAIDTHLDRLARALARTSWRCELGEVPDALLARAEANFGPLPADLRAFLARVRVLENHTGDVAFLTAADLADREGFVLRAVEGWRKQDEDSARPYPETHAEVSAFWSRIVPLVISTVNSDDLIALDRGSDPATVVEAWGERGWSDSARVCASSFTDFLAAMVEVFEAGPGAFECGWRLNRATISRLHTRDARYREPLLPIVFVTDFDAAAPPRRPSRPRVAIR